VESSSVVAHAWCDNGPPWQALLLDSPDRVLAVTPESAALAGQYVAVAALYPDGSPVSMEVRAFFPGGPGLVEDPVTGSLNAALGQWLIGAGLLPDSYVAAQGTCVGRAGRVHVERRDGTVWVGGSCVTVIEGVLRL
jgi:predicted PhzF superfamily epimerase YddE/YHI9